MQTTVYKLNVLLASVHDSDDDGSDVEGDDGSDVPDVTDDDSGAVNDDTVDDDGKSNDSSRCLGFV